MGGPYLLVDVPELSRRDALEYVKQITVSNYLGQYVMGNSNITSSLGHLAMYEPSSVIMEKIILSERILMINGVLDNLIQQEGATLGELTLKLRPSYQEKVELGIEGYSTGNPSNFDLIISVSETKRDAESKGTKQDKSVYRLTISHDLEAVLGGRDEEGRGKFIQWYDKIEKELRAVIPKLPLRQPT